MAGTDSLHPHHHQHTEVPTSLPHLEHLESCGQTSLTIDSVEPAPVSECAIPVCINHKKCLGRKRLKSINGECDITNKHNRVQQNQSGTCATHMFKSSKKKHPCGRLHVQKKTNSLHQYCRHLIDRGDDLTSNFLDDDLAPRGQDQVHHAHLQRSKASRTRCKRRRCFSLATAIKLPVCNGNNNSTHSRATRVLRVFQSAPPSAHSDDKLPQLSASVQCVFLRDPQGWSCLVMMYGTNCKKQRTHQRAPAFTPTADQLSNTPSEVTTST